MSIIIGDTPSDNNGVFRKVEIVGDPSAMNTLISGMPSVKFVVMFCENEE